MIEWVVSSSALILMLILMRRFLRKKLSMRVRYALWLAVALRLLIPVSFSESSLSVLNLLGQLSVSDEQDANSVSKENQYIFQENQGESVRFFAQMYSVEDEVEIDKLEGGVPLGGDNAQGSVLSVGDGKLSHVLSAAGAQWDMQFDSDGTQYNVLAGGDSMQGNVSIGGNEKQESTEIMGSRDPETQDDEVAVELELQNPLKTPGNGQQDSTGSIKGKVVLFLVKSAEFLAGNGERMALVQWLRLVWMFGMFFFFGLVVLVNFRYWKCVYRSRKRYQGEGESRLPVYVSSVVRMPCMFGLLHPAVYLGQDVMEEKTLRYILCHENTHYRHKDNLWTFLRLFCVCIHWFNPLVWLAAYLSKQDCELACDEETIVRLGNENRIDYGRTLLSLSLQGGEIFGGLRFSTTMSGRKKQLKERLQMIAAQPEKNSNALIMALLFIPLMFMITFTGSKTAEAFEGKGPEVSPENRETDVYEKDGGSAGVEAQESSDGSLEIGFQERDVGRLGAGFQESDVGALGDGFYDNGSDSQGSEVHESGVVGSEDGFGKDSENPKSDLQKEDESKSVNNTRVSIDLNDGINYTLQVISSSAAVNGCYEISQVNLCQAGDDTEEVLQSICPGDVKPFYTEALLRGEDGERRGGQQSLFRSEGEPLYAKSLCSIEEVSAYDRGQFLADGSGTQLSYLPDGGILVADLNFDGYDDFCLQIGVDSVNRPFYCYLWNPEKKCFEHSDMIPNVQVNQETQLIESATEDGEGQHSVKYYRFDEAGILHMVRYVEENQSPDAVFPFLDLTYHETSYALPAVDSWDAGTEYGGALNERYVYWAKEALTELYEWSGTKIDTVCFAVTWYGDFCFGQTPQDLDASRSFYDRTFGARAGFCDVIEWMNLDTERVAWYSPVVQWKVPEQLESMTDSQVVEWYFERSALTEGESIETIEMQSESSYVIKAESGNYYEITLNRASREVKSVYGPYDNYPMH